MYSFILNHKFTSLSLTSQIPPSLQAAPSPSTPLSQLTQDMLCVTAVYTTRPLTDSTQLGPYSILLQIVIVQGGQTFLQNFIFETINEEKSEEADFLRGRDYRLF